MTRVSDCINSTTLSVLNYVYTMYGGSLYLYSTWYWFEFDIRTSLEEYHHGHQDKKHKV